MFKLHLGLVAARNALEEKDFWPGYVEGVTRLTLTLLGDYPDYRKRKSGRKQDDHYKLNSERTVHFAQTPEQRFRTLIDAGNYADGLGLSLLGQPQDAFRQFRSQHKHRKTQTAFLEWYCENFPEDYVSVFR
jgi:hypothetical protein